MSMLRTFRARTAAESGAAVMACCVPAPRPASSMKGSSSA